MGVECEEDDAGIWQEANGGQDDDHIGNGADDNGCALRQECSPAGGSQMWEGLEEMEGHIKPAGNGGPWGVGGEGHAGAEAVDMGDDHVELLREAWCV